MTITLTTSAIRRTAIPLVLASLLTACSTAPTAKETAQKTTKEAIAEGTTTNPQSIASNTDNAVTFGVLSIDSAVAVNERYSPLLDYLSEEIGRPVELTILSQKTQFTEVEAGNLDFATTNPLSAVQIQRLYNTDFLVTVSRPKTGSEFGGLIVVDSNSDITSVEDLKDKRAACVNFQTAAAGCTFQTYHLLQQGFNPEKDFSSFTENKSQDNIVLSVLNGTIDVGFIRTGQLEKMLGKGLIDSLDDLRIIDLANDDFFYPHTTALYPEWPIAALAETDPQLSQQVKTALLELPSGHPALTALKVETFLPAVDYDPINSLIEALQLKGWDTSNASE
ncbi:MAG: phosphate/phosphite/phosphonate ABC transporter substrate-binding protein [Phormidesmis sp.]